MAFNLYIYFFPSRCSPNAIKLRQKCQTPQRLLCTHIFKFAKCDKVIIVFCLMILELNAEGNSY